MYDYLAVYTDMNLTLTMITTVIIYSFALIQFLSPFSQKKISLWSAGAAYAAAMSIMYFIPKEFNNLPAYGAAVIIAFSVFAVTDKRNYWQKLFLAFTFFSLRWISAAVSNVLYLSANIAFMGYFLNYVNRNDKILLSVFIIFDTIRDIILTASMLFSIKIFHKVYISKYETMSAKEALLLIIPSVSNVFNYRIMLYFNSIDTREIIVKPYDLTSFMYYLVCYASTIVVILFYEQIKASGRKEKEQAMLSVQTDNIREYISGAENLYRDIRAIRHDMRNHLTVLEKLHERGENEAFDRYLSEAKDRISADNGIVSGDPVTDVILTEKQGEALRRGIVFECDFHYPPDFSAGALDMSIILNNALNNAIEAAEKCSETERKISISSFKNNNAFTITIVNSCADNIEIQNGSLPHTTKSDSVNHGFGLVNIRNTAEKYKGGIDIESSDGKFILTVMLMLK